MSLQTITITGMLDGWSQTKYLSSKNAIDSSIGIDPDLSLTATDTKTSGMMIPVAYEDFSTTGLSGAARWLVTNPKDTLLYVYASDGELISYTSGLTSGSETVIGTPTSGAGNGMNYYNNYIYLMTPTDVSRYGPMNNSPSLTNTVWSGSTLGSQRVTINTTYPSLRGLPIPNHAGHVHGDNALYFCDFVAGQGVIHKIKTDPTLDYDAQSGNFTAALVVTGGTSAATATIVSDADSGSTGTLVLSGIKGVFQNNETITDSGSGSATVNGTITEGSGNNGTSYNVLDLPLGYLPVDIESWGRDLVILAIQTSDTTINQGSAALFFWDPTDTVSFYRGPVFLADPLATALLNVNGSIRIFSGNASSGVRVSKYVGGNTVSNTSRDTEFLEDSLPPFAGAVDAFGSKGVWGGFTTYPENSACVWSLGSKEGKVNMGVHNIVRTNSASSTNQNAVSVKFVQQADNKQPRVVVGWHDGSNDGIDKLSTTATINSVWRSKLYVVGQRFQIKQIRIPLGKAVASNMEIVPKVFIDEESTSSTLSTINSTNFTGSERAILYKEPELSNLIGKNSFFLELNHGDVTTLPVLFPIRIDLDLFDDEDN